MCDTDNTDALANMLEQASGDMMAHDPIVRKAFSVALLASDLYVPVHDSEEGQAEQGGVNLQAVDIDGTLHILLFSSQEKLGEYMKNGTRFARAPGSDILPALRTAHAILNPGEHGRIIAPEDIAEILGGAPAHDGGHVHGPDCNH